MILRRIFAAVALLCAIAVPAYAQKTKAQLNTEITTTFPDNTVGAITPAGVRAYESDVVNSIMPTAPVMSGNLACFNGTTGLLQDCGAAPATVPLTVGTTPINGGTTTRVLYDNAGKIGEYTNAQLTSLINPATASLPGALPAWPNNTTTYFRGDGTYQTLNIGAIGGLGTGVQAALGNALNGTGGVQGTTYISPVTYGVACTGGDDTATLQAWFNAVVAAHATALFPASYGGLTCHTTGNTLIAPQAFTIESQSPIGVTITASACNISTLAILGQAYGTNPNSGGAGNFTIRNVKFTGCGNNGIPLLINNALYWTLDHVTTIGGSVGALYVQGSEGDLYSHQSYGQPSLTIGGGLVQEIGTVSVGSSVVSGLNTQVLLAGMSVTGPDIQSGTTIASCGAISAAQTFCDASGSIVLSKTATASTTAEALTFWSANVTSSGPAIVSGGNFQNQGGTLTGPSIRIAGGAGGLLFAGCFIAANGNSASAVQIDGDPTGLAVGDATFKNCHTESTYNAANTMEQFLIGSLYKAGTVSIEGGAYYGHGNSVNYSRDLVDVIAARSVTVDGVLATSLGNTGFSRSVARLETTFPAAGDKYRFVGDINNGSGSMYSDANGRLSGSGDASFDTMTINTLTLGNALTTLNGGTGLKGTLTGARKANGTGVDTQAACADLSDGATACVPQGAWASYTPTVAAQTPGGTPPTFASTSAFYTQLGKTILMWGTTTVSAAGTGTGAILFSLPVTLKTGFNGGMSGSLASGVSLGVNLNFANFSSNAAVYKYDGTTVIVNGNVIGFSGSYQAN